jgi:hypothetical protein
MTRKFVGVFVHFRAPLRIRVKKMSMTPEVWFGNQKAVPKTLRRTNHVKLRKRAGGLYAEAQKTRLRSRTKRFHRRERLQNDEIINEPFDFTNKTTPSLKRFELISPDVPGCSSPTKRLT